MSSDIAVLNQKVDDLGGNVQGINKELKTMNKSLTDLIRIDGNIKRIEEKTDRMGAENDDHENRIRALEAKSGKLLERISSYVLSISIGAVSTLLILKGLK